MARAFINDQGELELHDVDPSRMRMDDAVHGVIDLDKRDFADLELSDADWALFNAMEARGEDMRINIFTTDGQRMDTTGSVTDIISDEPKINVPVQRVEVPPAMRVMETILGQSLSGAGVHSRAPRMDKPLKTKPYQLKRDNRNRPEPTLADDLLFTKKRLIPQLSRKEHERQLAALRKARRFVFDDAATERVARMCMNSPDMLADHSEFARAPFESTWIECNPHILHEVFRGFRPKFEEDTRIGFLFSGNTVYTGVKNADSPGRRGSATFLPQVYKLHEPMSFEDEMEACRLMGVSRQTLDSFFWGASYDYLDPTRRRSLRASHTLQWAFDREMPDRSLSNMVQHGGAGDLRVIIALSLMLVRPSMLKVIYEVGEERHRTVTGPRTFFTHNVVTIKMRPEAMVRRICTAARKEYAPKRRHEVRGTYCHDRAGKSRGCIHDWREIEPTLWECERCHGKRWWRKAHERGDVNRGWVNKHYVVQP